MNPVTTFIHSWLLGGMSYPALTFVITAAMKSAALVLLAWALTRYFLNSKPALMRLWVWRGCIVGLASVLLWALAPGMVDAWRPSVTLAPTAQMAQTFQQARSLEILKEKSVGPIPMKPVAPLVAYSSPSAEPRVSLVKMRTPWLARVEQRVVLIWWSIAALVLGIKIVRSICGHFWLRRSAAGTLSGTDHRLVRGLVSPVVTGWWKAHIWLPLEAVEWPQAKIRAVCLHETAHHERHDGAWQWLGWLTVSVWWWNPLCWLALRQLNVEAEHSADEAALGHEITAPDYAQVLVEIAAGGTSHVPAAGVAMLGRSGIHQRVQAILSGAGRGGHFGSKARLVFIISCLAAMLAAGVEVRQAAVQIVKPSEPLTQVEKALVERCLTTLESQARELAKIHLKMTQSWTLQGKEEVRSSQPSMIEAWVDEAAGKSRAEYRPRVSPWTNGAAPWFISDVTKASDGQVSWSYDGDDSTSADAGRGARYHFFSPWLESRTDELVESLRQLRDGGFKKWGLYTHQIGEAGGRVFLERAHTVDHRHMRWEFDAGGGGLALKREWSSKTPENVSFEWEVKQWAQMPDGTRYPAKWNWRHPHIGRIDYENQITMIEKIPSILETLLALPQKKSSPYVSNDGIPAHGEWLEARFLHSETGKPVPAVKVHFEINEGKREELISDAQGVLRIPLPKEEVKRLRYWGMKPGFVMQMVAWSRQGDPLKLPDVYETKLYPLGKPIGGIVVDEQSKPVSGAAIHITHTGGPRSWSVFTDMHSRGEQKVQTDSQGKWSMTGFAKDLKGLSIRVEHPRFKRVAMSYEHASGQAVEALRDGTSRVVLKSSGLEFHAVVSDTKNNKIEGCRVTLSEDRWGRYDEPNAKSDAEGRVILPIHEAGKEWFTFEADGFAPMKLELDMNAESAKPLVVARLEPGKILKARVVDESGSPLANVRMVANRWQDSRTLWFEAVTDAEGRIEWRGAPHDEVGWTILGREDILRDVPLKAAEAEQTVVLRPAIRFSGTVRDSKTGVPVTVFKVTHGDTRRRTGQDIYWRDDEARSFRDGTFTFENWDMRFDHKLRFEAEGYEPFESALFSPNQQDEKIEVRLNAKR
ncbi:MAG: M56 family metallopeptidase [Verrucomicrobiota bacterium]